MQESYSFGFEAEFQTNVQPLVARLHDAGLCGSPEMHRYHCGCEYCGWENGYAFRAQTDSSCGGEVITDIQYDVDEARDIMVALQEHAVEVDAEPSLDAGLHVHVGAPPPGSHQRADAFWAYLRWEEVLGSFVAPGRWPSMRAANRRTASDLRDINPGRTWDWHDAILDSDLIGLTPPWRTASARRQGVPFNPLWVEERVDTNDAAMLGVKYLIEEHARDLDRHSWLNLSTRGYNTFEFRLWNATRVAWRMEMFVRASLLFMNPEAHGDLLRLSVIPSEAELLRVAGRHDPALKRLLRRQLNSPKGFEPFSDLTPPPDDQALATAIAPTPPLRW